MPYIPREQRGELDPAIDDLAARIAVLAARTETDLAVAGLLNYSCTRLALSVIRLRFTRVRYGAIALVAGTFHTIADEFYRRIAGPYEDRQIERNGDVDILEELAGEIGRS